MSCWPIPSYCSCSNEHKIHHAWLHDRRFHSPLTGNGPPQRTGRCWPDTPPTLSGAPGSGRVAGCSSVRPHRAPSQTAAPGSWSHLQFKVSYCTHFQALGGFFLILNSSGAASHNLLCKTSLGLQITAYLALTLKHRGLTSPFQCTF